MQEVPGLNILLSYSTATVKDYGSRVKVCTAGAVAELDAKKLLEQGWQRLAHNEFVYELEVKDEDKSVPWEGKDEFAEEEQELRGEG